MRYRNVITGAEIEVNSEIIAPNWEKLGAIAPKVIPEVIPEDKPKEKPKTAPKKTTKRTRK